MNKAFQDTSHNSELKMIAWEVTRSCNLSCIHCRASAERGPYPGEFSTEECLRLIDDIVGFSNPVIILTGGEPMMRKDIFEIAEYGTQKGLRMVMAPNGTLIDEENARKMVRSGIKRISISLDGATGKSHDNFRQVEGAFQGALRGIEYAKKTGLEFQINTTVTSTNIKELPNVLDLAIELGAAAHHIFLIVPTGRAKELKDNEIPSEEYEETLHWFYNQREKTSLHLKATCAPHYYRILRQRAKEEGKKITFDTYGLDAVTRGCLGGVSFCFISHTGQVQPCGYFELNCGEIRKSTLKEIWTNSEIFHSLRDFDKYNGKCGICEYRQVCGGCRARAYEFTGDYLGEEPYCTYQPKRGELRASPF
ncbi:MAG: radical SAM domain-containing protein [bacterium]|nr:MAG: radical SAM domain-containing protein [bacterium]